MSVPWLKRLSGRAEVKHFPVTNAPIMFLLPNRAGVPIYGQPQPTVMMMGPRETPLPPPPPRPRPPIPPISVVYANTPQTCVNTCPEGTTGEPISVTVGAGEYTSDVSQEAANAAAMAAACAEAAALREENPCVESNPQSLWGWGEGARFALGMGDSANRLTPTLVGTEQELAWIKVAGDRTFSAGLKSDGTLWTWGTCNQGELGIGLVNAPGGTTANRYFPTQVGSDTWLDVSSGEQFALGIKTDGTLWSWGLNNLGQLGLGDTTRRLSPTQVGSASNWVAVACGRRHALVLNSSGELWVCGENGNAQLGLNFPIPQSSLIQVSGSWTWAAGGYDHTIAIKADGTIWIFSLGFTGNTTPTQSGSDSDWALASGGEQYSMAIKTNGTLWGIGLNNVGQLGIGSTAFQFSFSQVGSDTDWENVLASSMQLGAGHTLAFKSGGTIWGWGQNSAGQLGQGIVSAAQLSPVQIGPDNQWTGIGIGFAISFGFRSTIEPPPPPAGTDGVAMGGTLTIAGGYHIHRFEIGTNTFQVINGSGVLFDVLIVGAGGGGAMGGGGSGEFIKQTGISLANGDYVVTVGSIGLGQPTGTQGGDGGSTTFNGNTALGGAGGGAYSDEAIRDGRDGGSGGGGGGSLSGPPAGIKGTGSAGGDGGDASRTAAAITCIGAGGGGGASSNGADGTSSGAGAAGGDGGTGTSDSISGTAVVYCAGGGGGAATTIGGTEVGGSGGSSVGGNGGAGMTPSTEPLTPGSGGGGWSGGGTSGGMGTVIIRYLSPP
jgi:alpha-tubulin suppressor-like RCC1 family protein